MGRLDKIRDILYKPGEKKEKLRADVPFQGGQRSSEAPTAWSDNSGSPLLERAWQKSVFRSRDSLRFLAGVAGIFFAMTIGFFGYLYFFAGRDARLEVLGPAEITAGEPAPFTVRITNKGRVALKEGVLTLTFGQGVIGSDSGASPFETLRERMEIPEIPAGGEYQRDLSVVILGRSGEEKAVEGFFVYRPENLQSQLTRSSTFRTRIIRVPLAIAVDVPEEASSGQEITLQVGVDSELGVPMQDLSLGVDFPRGFAFRSADPALFGSEETIWPLGELKPGESKKIILKGEISGDPRETKEFRFRLGRYDPVRKAWITITEQGAGPRIASPFLFVQARINGKREGIVFPGEKIEGAIAYKNNLSQKLQNITVALSFPEKFVDLETVRTERGFYDATRRMLVWDAGSAEELKELDSGEESEFAFSFVLKNALPVHGFSDKNFSFPLSVVIDTVSPPPDFRGVSLAFRDSAEFKIGSRLAIAARSAFYDSPVENTGPLPPRARKKTSYTILFQISNGANDLRDVEVRSSLSGNIEWVKSVSTDRGAVEFNAASREVVWRIRDLPAGTGMLRSPASAVFQVALTPAENQIGSIPNILEGVFASGQDGFTGEAVSANTPPITTELRADPRSTSQDWMVGP